MAGEWRKCKNRDGVESKYAETDGTYTVSAGKSQGQWYGLLWKGNGQVSDVLIARFNSPREAKAAAYDYL